MLFEYQQLRPAYHGFWMYQTLIPLDIAYLGAQGEIVSLRQMHPCASSRSSDCPAYPAGKPFLSAVEMNAGYFHERGIGTGDRLVWPARSEERRVGKECRPRRSTHQARARTTLQPVSHARREQSRQ